MVLVASLCVALSSHADNSPRYITDASIKPSLSSSNCRQPDSLTLAAILPITTDNGKYASGVVFDNDRVLTAAHVVQGSRSVFVRVGGAFRAAELIMLDHAKDLAVLSVSTQAIEPIPIADIDPDEADPVWAVGYPRAQAMSTSMGIFQNTREGILHTSASIDSGQSGGGLLTCDDGRWTLAGMLRGYGAYLQGDHYVKLENHSVSVAGTTINRFLMTYH